MGNVMCWTAEDTFNDWEDVEVVKLALEKFYAKHNPEKIPLIDENMGKYKGELENLVVVLCRLYKVTTSQMQEILNEAYTIVNDKRKAEKEKERAEKDKRKDLLKENWNYPGQTTNSSTVSASSPGNKSTTPSQSRSSSIDNLSSAMEGGTPRKRPQFYESQD